MALIASDSRRTEDLLSLTRDSDPQVSLAAVRALVPHTQKESIGRAFRSALNARQGQSSALGDQRRFALQLDTDERPRTSDQWRELLKAGGDVEAGRRVFFDGRVGCAKCHCVDGRGGRIGPDLSSIASAKSHDQILVSILHPSQDKSPDFQGYIVAMKDGRVFKGTQFHFRGESAELLLEDGRQIRFALSDTDEYRALEESLMPERLAETMAISEFRDLLTFLNSLRGPDVAPMGFGK
jgi:putative heme-binding domain-containing protein